MAAPPRLANLAARIFPAAFQRAVGGWLWPSQANPGWWGNGDRGPLGSWQMNLNGQQGGLELVAFSAVYACVNTIASDVSKLPVQVFSVDRETGARELRRDDYYAALMRMPNEYQTCTDLLLAFVQSYLLQGNTYGYVGRRNGRGEIEELHVLNPHKVRPFITDGGEVIYECGENFLAGLKPNTMVPARDMIHHRLPLLPGYPLIGVTPIFAAAASSAVGIRILQDSQQFFANSARPSGILHSKINLGEDQKRKVKEEWDSAYRGRDYGKVAVLPSGLEWAPMTITQQDAQLIEQLRWSVEDVARVFRVPPFMLGDMSKVSYRNTEQLGRAYLAGCLGYHLQAIERRLEAAFEFPPTFELQFDLSALLRTEIDVRFTAYREALNAGWQSINEVRTQEGLSPVKGGEEPRVQMQYVPLSKATEPPKEPIVVPPADDDPPPTPPDEDESSGDDSSPDELATINPERVRAMLREDAEGGMKRDLDCLIADALAEHLIAHQMHMEGFAERLVERLVAAKPIPPFVPPPAWVEGKRWPAGCSVRHRGGTFYAQRDTEDEPSRDDAWIPLIVGIAGIDVRLLEDGHTFLAITALSDGRIVENKCEIAVPIVRGYWEPEATYMPGDRVFRFGEWHCLKLALGVDPTKDEGAHWEKVGGKYARDIALKLDEATGILTDNGRLVGNARKEFERACDLAVAKVLAKRVA